MQNKNIYTLQAEMDVLAYFLALELGRMSYMMPNIKESERMLYKTLELTVHDRIDTEIMRAIERTNAIEKAHMMLREAGFNAWSLCVWRNKPKKSRVS